MPIQRKIDAHFAVSGGPPANQIPLFIAGYVGWKQMETLEQHLADVAEHRWHPRDRSRLVHKPRRIPGNQSLWCLGAVGADFMPLSLNQLPPGGAERSATVCPLSGSRSPSGAKRPSR